MKRRSLLPTPFLLIVSAAIACTPLLHVWLLPGSTLRRLTFVLGARTGRESTLRVERFELIPCAEREATIRAQPGTRWTEDERALWRITISGDPIGLSRIAYGETPTGFHASGPAGPLLAGGCYIARVRAAPGGGETVLRVDADGLLLELTDAEASALYESWRRSAPTK